MPNPSLRERLAKALCRWSYEAHGVEYSDDMYDAEYDAWDSQADAALQVFREWLESEAQVEPVARALGTLVGAKFDVFSELTGLPYDDWLAWSSEARAALLEMLDALTKGDRDAG